MKQFWTCPFCGPLQNEDVVSHLEDHRLIRVRRSYSPSGVQATATCGCGFQGTRPEMKQHWLGLNTREHAALLVLMGVDIDRAPIPF